MTQNPPPSWANPPTCNSFPPTGTYTGYVYETYSNLQAGQEPLEARVDPHGNYTFYGYNDNSYNGSNYGVACSNAPYTGYLCSFPGEMCWSAAAGVNTYGATCTSPPAGATVYGYDPYGDLVSELDPDGNETTWSYDADGDLLTEISPIGNTASPPGGQAAYTTTNTYYWPGELESIKAPYNGNSFSTTLYTYDADGNLLTTTDPSGYVTTATYDADDRICWIAPGSYSSPSCLSAPTGATVYSYVANTGNPSQVKNGDGYTTTYRYDNPSYSGDPTYVVDGSGNTTSYVYDADGNECLADPGTDLYANNNVPTCTWQQGASFASYNMFGQQTESETADGNVTTYSYDPRFETKPTQIETPIKTTVATYDADGNLIQTGTGSSPSTITNYTSMAYTPDNQLCDRVPNQTTLTSCPTSPSVAGESTYVYDPDGHPQTMKDDVNGNVAKTSYTYDANSETTGETESYFGTGNKATVGYTYLSGGEVSVSPTRPTSW